MITVCFSDQQSVPVTLVPANPGKTMTMLVPAFQSQPAPLKQAALLQNLPAPGGIVVTSSGANMPPGTGQTIYPGVLPSQLSSLPVQQVSGNRKRSVEDDMAVNPSCWTWFRLNL